MATGRIEPQAVVIFGASGDLTRRKLIPAFYHLFCEDLLPGGFALVGYARTKMSDEQFHDYAADAVKEFGRIEPAGDQWDAFRKRLSYIPGEFDDEGAMDHLVEHLGWTDKDQGTGGGRFFYAATPPGAYPSIIETSVAGRSWAAWIGAASTRLNASRSETSSTPSGFARALT